METGTSFTRLDHDSPERFVALRRALGVSTFGMNQMILRPGEAGRIHRHQRQEEVYVVLAGTLTVIVDGLDHALAAGDVMRVAPDVRRQLVNRGGEPVVLLALGGAEPHDGRDGEAFDSWEDTEPKPPADVPLPADGTV